MVLWSLKEKETVSEDIFVHLISLVDTIFYIHDLKRASKCFDVFDVSLLLFILMYFYLSLFLPF